MGEIQCGWSAATAHKPPVDLAEHWGPHLVLKLTLGGEAVKAHGEGGRLKSVVFSNLSPLCRAGFS
eukprot:1158382-Pelagomonas_calceolata.AAC.1